MGKKIESFGSQSGKTNKKIVLNDQGRRHFIRRVNVCLASGSFNGDLKVFNGYFGQFCTNFVGTLFPELSFINSQILAPNPCTETLNVLWSKHLKAVRRT